MQNLKDRMNVHLIQSSFHANVIMDSDLNGI